MVSLVLVHCGTSQGVVEGVGPGWVDVRVEEGYPGIDQIYDNSSHTGYHLNRTSSMFPYQKD